MDKRKTLPQLYKPGQSGNPKGRPPGSRNKFTEDFFRDMCEAWALIGPAAIIQAALDSPIDYLRVAASLMPKEAHATVTKVNLDRMSSDELRTILAETAGRADPS